MLSQLIFRIKRSRMQFDQEMVRGAEHFDLLTLFEDEKQIVY